MSRRKNRPYRRDVTAWLAAEVAALRAMEDARVALLALLEARTQREAES